MAARRAARRPALRGLLFLLVMAIGFGLLAAFLASPLPNAPAPSKSSSNSFQSSSYVPSDYLAIAILAVFFGFIAFQVFGRFQGGRVPIPTQFVALALAAFLVGGAFLLVVHFVETTATGGGQNATNSSGAGGSSTSSAPTPNGTSNGTLLPIYPIPGEPRVSWFDLGLIVLVLGVVIAVVIVARLEPTEGDGSGGDDGSAARLRKELEGSLRRLEQDPEADPREVIRALYHRLLLALRPRLGTLEMYTVREVEAVIVTAYGVRAENAHELSALFEEARYSHHPLGRLEAERAKRALQGVLLDVEAWSTLRERQRAELSARAEASPRRRRRD
jgi:hypothetical protein